MEQEQESELAPTMRSANARKLDQLYGEFFPRIIKLSDEDARLEEDCRNSLYYFLQTFWPVVEGTPFIGGWHLQAEGEHLEAVLRKDIKDLIINVPPRTGKSSLCSVMYPAWVWINNPRYKFICASYSEKFAGRDSMKCRMLIESPLFKRLWGDKFHIRRDVRNILKFQNNLNGFREAASIGGSNTGGGAEFLICDDPNSMADMYSHARRETVSNWFTGIMPTRFTLITERRRIIVQQRGHVEDLTGEILSRDDPEWVYLYLPLEFETKRRCVTIPLPSTGKSKWVDPRKKEGELLWEEGLPRKEIDRLKKYDFNNQEYLIAGQLQQRPAVEGGGMLKGDWFQRWTEPDKPDFVFILQSWDTAMVGDETASYSVGTTWGVFNDDTMVPNLMLLSMFHGQLNYPDLRKMMARCARNYHDTDFKDPYPATMKEPVDMVLIEEKSTGQLLVRDLFVTEIPVNRFNPTKYGDKRGRCMIASQFIENGRVWLPTKGPKHKQLTGFAQKLYDAAVVFPNPSHGSTSSDIIDSMSQALIRLRDDGWLMNKTDIPTRRDTHKSHKVQPYYAD